jgi:hypothetical protein
MKCWQKAIGQLSNFFLKISSLIVFLCYFLLDHEVAKKSSCREKTTPSILRYRSSGHPSFLFLRKSRRGNARHLSLLALFSALFLFLALSDYISLKLEKHESGFYPIPSSPHHFIPLGSSSAGNTLSSGDAQCGWQCDGE